MRFFIFFSEQAHFCYILSLDSYTGDYSSAGVLHSCYSIFQVFFYLKIQCRVTSENEPLTILNFFSKYRNSYWKCRKNGLAAILVHTIWVLMIRFWNKKPTYFIIIFRSSLKSHSFWVTLHCILKSLLKLARVFSKVKGIPINMGIQWRIRYRLFK